MTLPRVYDRTWNSALAASLRVPSRRRKCLSSVDVAAFPFLQNPTRCPVSTIRSGLLACPHLASAPLAWQALRAASLRPSSSSRFLSSQRACSSSEEDE